MLAVETLGPTYKQSIADTENQALLTMRQKLTSAFLLCRRFSFKSTPYPTVNRITLRKLSMVKMNDLTNEIITCAKTQLKSCFEENDVPWSHGLDHAETVLNHCLQAIANHEVSSNTFELSRSVEVSLALAALLHDADDRKYFREGSQNAKRICISCLETQHFPDAEKERIVDNVLTMISLVSFSKNGNHVPEVAVKHPYMLWPRFSDRLEAIGTTGAIRCWQYSEVCTFVAPFPNYIFCCYL